jgi:hypothetical protein
MDTNALSYAALACSILAIIILPWAYERRKPKRPPVAERIVRPDYRIFDMREMTKWGHSAFWVHGDKQVCIFSQQSPRVGDVIIDGIGEHYAIVTVERMANPDDQFFVSPKHFNKKDLPERVPSKNWVEEDLIQ